MPALLDRLRLGHGGVAVEGTPRRLAVIVHALDGRQSSSVERARGPPAKVAYDAAGAPTPALLGFCKKNGVTGAPPARHMGGAGRRRARGRARPSCQRAKHPGVCNLLRRQLARPFSLFVALVLLRCPALTLTSSCSQRRSGGLLCRGGRQGRAVCVGRGEAGRTVGGDCADGGAARPAGQLDLPQEHALAPRGGVLAAPPLASLAPRRRRAAPHLRWPASRYGWRNRWGLY